jgi:hypothetical protein
MGADEGKLRPGAGGYGSLFGNPRNEGQVNGFFGNRVSMVDWGDIFKDVSGYHIRS